MIDALQLTRNVKQSPIRGEVADVKSGLLGTPVCAHTDTEPELLRFQTSCNTDALICTSGVVSDRAIDRYYR